jgi:5-formyltetrahydrofolate cyclo-ligase
MNDNEYIMTKKELRILAKNIRSEIFNRTDKTKAFETLLLEYIVDSKTLHNNSELIVGMYVPIYNEIELPLYTDQFQIALPVIRSKTNLEFYAWDKDEKLVRRDFDIPVPDTRFKSPVIPDILCMPLLFCDKNGTRLGYGAGHYDRYISGFDEKPLCIGACFDEQVYKDNLPNEPHDQKLDLIITPSRIITIK